MKGFRSFFLFLPAILILFFPGCEPEKQKDYSFLFKKYEGIHAAITTIDSNGNEFLYPAFYFSITIDEDFVIFNMDDQELEPSAYKITNDDNDYIELETSSMHNSKLKTYKMKYDKNNGTIILCGLMGGADFELYPERK